jgi:hypothetical protein
MLRLTATGLGRQAICAAIPGDFRVLRIRYLKNRIMVCSSGSIGAAAPAVFTAGVCLRLPQLELSRNSLSHAGEGLITNPQTWSDGSGNRRQMQLGDGIGVKMDSARY